MPAFLMTPVKWLRSEKEKETVKAKCEQAEMETEELIKLIHLVGCEVRERQEEKILHPLIFLNTLYESYQITGCIWKALRIKIDLGLLSNFLVLLLFRGLVCSKPHYELNRNTVPHQNPSSAWQQWMPLADYQTGR